MSNLTSYSFKFLGGSLNCSPKVTFQGKTGPVELPDRIVLKLEGTQITLTAAAIDAINKLPALERARPFLDEIRKVEEDAQND
jgi:hypothetical protein